MGMDCVLQELMIILKQYKIELDKHSKDMPSKLLQIQIESVQTKIESVKKSSSMSRESVDALKTVIEFLNSFKKEIDDVSDSMVAYSKIKELFNEKVKELGQMAKGTTAKAYENVFCFLRMYLLKGRKC